MRVQRNRADRLNSLHHRQSERQVGYEVIVHDVHVDGIRIADPMEFRLKVDEIR